LYSKVNKNEYILKLYGFDMERRIIAFEWMDNTLRGYINSGRMESIKEESSFIKKINILIKISKGLEYVHENDILHCDLSSDNIMLNFDNDEEIKEVKIIDFGISHNVNDKILENLEKKYMIAPEIKNFEIKYNTIETDIYSFGIIMLEVIFFIIF
jgi:serine/threonine protein kinase